MQRKVQGFAQNVSLKKIVYVVLNEYYILTYEKHLRDLENNVTIIVFIYFIFFRRVRRHYLMQKSMYYLLDSNPEKILIYFMGKKTPIFGNRIYESTFIKLASITSIQPQKTRYEPTLSTQSSALLVGKKRDPKKWSDCNARSL